MQVEQRGQPQRFQLECRCGRSQEAVFVGPAAKRKGGEPETEQFVGGLGPDLAEAHEIVVGLARPGRFEVGGEVADVVENLPHPGRELG